MSFAAGLAVGLAVSALQAVLILRTSRTALWAVVLTGLLLAVPFLAALSLFESSGGDLGVVTGQIALLALGPELAEAHRRRKPGSPTTTSERRATVWFLRVIQVGAVVMALLRLDDPAAMAPLLVAALALERSVRYATSR